ncbi:MAG: hypothetical protein AB7S38_38535 [Vulcanimicrobiota bacterium]
MISGLKNLAIELLTRVRIDSNPAEERAFMVYSEDRASYLQFGPYLEALEGCRVLYLTSAPDDPLLKSSPDHLTVGYLRWLAPNFLAGTDARLLMVTMPELGCPGAPRPQKTRCVYIFHSLISVHMGYPEGAFDHYDDFFCTGPHHQQELEKRFADLGRPPPRLHQVGYAKLDAIHAEHQTYAPRHPELETVLVAPSWATENILSLYGTELVRQLLGAGYRVVVRPHPCFFQSLYPEGQKVVADLERAFGGDSRFVLEKTIHGNDSFHEAALMIGDWSGAAFEYAFATARPVLFVDTPPKVRNPNWKACGLPVFEDVTRYEVGRVVGGLDGLLATVKELLGEGDEGRSRRRALRQEKVYHFGSSAEVGARLLEQLLAEGKS